METTLRFSGYVGSVLLAFGILGALIVGSFTANILIVLQLVLGVLFLALWAVTWGVQGVSKASQVLTGRGARFGYNAILYSLVFAGLLVVANIFVARNDRRWDLTEQRIHSLSEKSVALVSGLTKPLRMVAIDTSKVLSLAGAADPETTRELLRLYKYHSPKQVSVEIIDPRAKPVEIERLGMKQGNVLYLEYGDPGQSSISRINAVDEQSITNAILKLTRGVAKKFYYIEGHGEPELSAQSEEGMKSFSDALANEHILVEGLLLPQVGKIPGDAAAVAMVAPRKPLNTAERDVLIQYVGSGGRLILMADPESGADEEVRVVAKSFGIEVGKDVILDKDSQIFTGGPQVFVAMGFSPHPITAKLSGRQPPVFAYASSVVAPTGNRDGGTYSEILKTGNNSWAERDVAKLLDPSGGKGAYSEAEDLKGPVPVVVTMEKKIPGSASDTSTPTSRVVVFGDATWVRNDSLAAMGNQDLLVNTVNWTMGEEGAIAIGPKRMRQSELAFTQADFNVVLALSFLGPELILLLGLFVWWRRQTSLA